MSLREDAARLAVLRELRDRLEEEISTSRQQVWAELAVARATLGVTSVAVELADGVKLGTVSVVTPKDGIDVDPAGLLAWVRECHPDELVQAVRESFRRAVLAHLKPGEDGQVVHAGTGEVVPWARVRPAGEPTAFTYRPAAGASAAIVEAYRAGRLGPALLPSIDAPEGSPPA